MHILPLIVLLSAGLTGCLNFDGMVHNPVHCSTVSTATCEDNVYWDKVCVPCETPYAWEQAYEWMASTLEEGQTIRPIEAASVVNHRVTTEDGLGTLDAYFIPSHGEVPELAQTTILYNHGNYAGIEHYLPRLQMLHEAGYNIVVWDYRGYGKSEPASAPNPDMFLADARQIREIAKTWVPDPTKIIVYAFSLGGIPALEMSVADPGCALFLEAAFTSIQALVRSGSTLEVPEGFFSQGAFANTTKVKSYPGPLFVMIGTLDNKFPVDDAREFYENASGPKEFWVVENVDHGIANTGIPEDSFSTYRDKLLGFLQTQAPECLNL